MGLSHISGQRRPPLRHRRVDHFSVRIGDLGRDVVSSGCDEVLQFVNGGEILDTIVLGPVLDA
jgi:hypothetical protein